MGQVTLRLLVLTATHHHKMSRQHHARTDSKRAPATAAAATPEVFLTDIGGGQIQLSDTGPADYFLVVNGGQLQVDDSPTGAVTFVELQDQIKLLE